MYKDLYNSVFLILHQLRMESNKFLLGSIVTCLEVIHGTGMLLLLDNKSCGSRPDPMVLALSAT